MVKEHAEKLIEICVESESVRSLRAQALHGFYTLLSFDNLLANFDLIIKCVWHSIWIDPAQTGGLDDEKSVHFGISRIVSRFKSIKFLFFYKRKKVIEIVHMMSQKDARLKDELLTALYESISAKSGGNSNYANSFRIIEYLVTLDDKSKLYEKQLLTHFESLVDDLVKQPTNQQLGDSTIDYLACLLDSFNQVVRSSSGEAESQVVRVVDKLVDFFVQADSSSSPIYSNDRLVLKLSLVVKSLVLKYNQSF